MDVMDIIMLAKISSLHVFPSGKAIVKYPLDETENRVYQSAMRLLKI